MTTTEGTGEPPPGPIVLRTGPWRGAPLLTKDAWQVLSSSALVLGLRSDPYAVALAAQLPLELLDVVAQLRPRVEAVALGVGGAVVVVDSAAIPELTTCLTGWAAQELDGQPAVRGLRLLDAVALLNRLRSPGGCPWDAAQTHESLRPYLLEEAQEAVEAIDSGDVRHLAEELGDVLLQVLFHARLGQEDAEPFDVDDIAGGLIAKLVRRHPHVFGDVVADTPAEVAANWKRIKAAERAGGPQVGEDAEGLG